MKEGTGEKEVADAKPDFVKWFSELNKGSGSIAGGKGANLSEIYNLKISVPPGFVVTAQAYDYFIKKAGLDSKIKELLSTISYEETNQLDKVTKEIRALIEKAKMPEEMREEVLEAYETLGTEESYLKDKSAHYLLKKSPEPVFVAVRSSATTEDLAQASFAGQQDTFLNVKGNDALITHIKKCFSSLFTPRATYYRNKQGFKDVQASLAVVVQRMIDSDKSGVMFSKDPTMSTNHLIVEAVFGLGEGIVSGTITPDTYILSRNSDELKILSKTIGTKKVAITRNSAGDSQTVKLREEKAKQQVLKEFEINRLAEIAIKLEEHYKKPQDIEFAIEGEGIYIVQTRPITTLTKQEGTSSSQGKDIQGEVVLTGLAASPGIGAGKVKIIADLADLGKVNKGDVLVTKMTNPDMVVTMQKCAAIVTDEGGLTAHASIVSREMGIPAVVGTDIATTKLKEGEMITVDGSTGKIYKGKVAETSQKEIKPVTKQTKTHLKLIVDLPTFAERAARTKLTEVGLARLEGTIAESGKHPEYFLQNNKISDYEEIIFKGISGIAEHFDEIWVRTSDIRSDEFRNLEGAPKEVEANPMLGMHGIRYSLTHPEILKAELKAMQRVADSKTEPQAKIGILTPQVISVEEIQQLKKILQEIGFNDAKIGAMIETPAAVHIIEELCQEKIDFVSFGTNDLTQYTLAIDRGNGQVQNLYNELHPAILKQMAHVIKVCKRYNVESSICGQAGSKRPMAKFLVEQGIDSISVNADVAADIAEYISELESKQTTQQETPTPAKEKPLPPTITEKENETDESEANEKSTSETVEENRAEQSESKLSENESPELSDEVNSNSEGGIDLTHEKKPSEEEMPKIPGAEYIEENLEDNEYEEVLDIF